MKDDKKKVEEQETQQENVDAKEDKKKIDNRTLGEKLEDGIDDTMGAVEDFFYGDELTRDYQNDIPATRKMSSGRVVVNKVQTRKNISKKVMKTKFGKGIFIILGVGIIITIIYWILNSLLMA